MSNEDTQFTGLVAELIGVAKGFCKYGEDKGLLTPDGLKFAITKRKEIVKQLSDAGKSQREIAALVGVSVGTVSSDLNGGVQELNESVQKLNTPDPEPEEEVDEPEIEDEDEDSEEYQDEAERLRRIRAHMARAQDAVDYAHDDLFNGVKLSAQEWKEVLTIAKKAARACTAYASTLETYYHDTQT